MNVLISMFSVVGDRLVTLGTFSKPSLLSIECLISFRVYWRMTSCGMRQLGQPYGCSGLTPSPDTEGAGTSSAAHANHSATTLGNCASLRRRRTPEQTQRSRLEVRFSAKAIEIAQAGTGSKRTTWAQFVGCWRWRLVAFEIPIRWTRADPWSGYTILAGYRLRSRIAPTRRRWHCANPNVRSQNARRCTIDPMVRTFNRNRDTVEGDNGWK